MKPIEQIAKEFDEQQERLKGKKARECANRGRKMCRATNVVKKLFKSDDIRMTRRNKDGSFKGEVYSE